MKSESSDSDDDIWEYTSRKNEVKKNAKQTRRLTLKSQHASSSIIDDSHNQNKKKSGTSKNCIDSVTVKSKRKSTESNAKEDKKCKQDEKPVAVIRHSRSNDIDRSHNINVNQKIKSHSVSDKRPKSKTKNVKSAASKSTTVSSPDVENVKPGNICSSSFKSPCSSTGTEREGHCPFCQVPFSVLSCVDSPRWHVTECMDQVASNAKEECKAGMECDSTIPSHYQRYCHTLLAQLRAIAPCDLQNQGIHEDGDLLLEADKVSRKLTYPDASITDCKPVKHVKCSETVTEFKTCDAQSSFGGHLSGDLSSSPAVVTGVSMFKTSIGFSKCGLKDIHGDLEVNNKCSDSEDDIFCDTCSSPESHCDVQENGITPFSLYAGTRTGDRENDDKTIDKSSKLEDALPGLTGDAGVSQRDVSDLLEDIFDGAAIEETKSRAENLHLCDTSKMASSSHEKFFTFGAIRISPDKSARKCLSTEESSSCLVADNVTKFVGNTMMPHPTGSSGRKAQTKTPSKSPRTRSKSKTPGKSKVQASKHAKRTTPSKSQKLESQQAAGAKDMEKTKQRSITTFFLPPPGKQKPSEDSIVNNSKLPKSISQGKTSAMSAFTSLFSRADSSGASANLRQPKRAATSKADKAEDATASDSTESEGICQGRQTRKKKCPFYKKIPGTSFTVDAFSYGIVPGINAYFLSHFHYDHYTGLTKHFSKPIYCTQITANLVLKKICVQPSLIHVLALNVPAIVEGVEVTLIEANHCPGAVLFVFRPPDGKVYLHTGDFRADPSMEAHPALQGITVDQLYLDTTYCDPAYAFPPQQEVIDFAVQLAVNFIQNNPKGLIVVGSYTIGKERVFQAIADTLDCKICVTREKKNILDCLEDDTLSQRVTLKVDEAKVHVLPMRQLRYPDLLEYVTKLQPRFSALLALEPTGWTHSQKLPSLQNLRPKANKPPVTHYGIPYSEHSSYEELKRFVQAMRPHRILPTVNNGNAEKRHKMESLFAAWTNEAETSQCSVMRQSGMNTWVNSSTTNR